MAPGPDVNGPERTSGGEVVGLAWRGAEMPEGEVWQQPFTSEQRSDGRVTSQEGGNRELGKESLGAGQVAQDSGSAARTLASVCR